MSDIAGHLVPQKPEARVAENTNALPLLVTDGRVMKGELTAVERIAEDCVEAPENARLEGDGGELPGGLIRKQPRNWVLDEFYPSVEDYDSVLVWHCGWINYYRHSSVGRWSQVVEIDRFTNGFDWSERPKPL